MFRPLFVFWVSIYSYPRQMFDTLFNSLLTLVYPQQCRICGNSVEKSADGAACSECWEKVRLYGKRELKCRKCGAYLGQSDNDGFGAQCGRCEHHFYDKAWAAGVYEHGLAAAIIQLKSDPYISPRCRLLLLKTFSQINDDENSVLVPVPLSEKRMLERGYNQAEVLARYISAETRTPLRIDVLIRKQHTLMHRAAMDERGREMTVEKAFDVTRKRAVRDAQIILVDDVLTSGSTVSTCAKVLKKSGAKRVDVLTLARAVQ